MNPIDPTILAGEVAKQGLGYVLFILSAIAFVWQIRRNDTLSAEIKLLNQQITALQEKRLMDATQYAESYLEASKEAVGTMKDNTATLSLIKQSVETLARGIESITKH